MRRAGVLHRRRQADAARRRRRPGSTRRRWSAALALTARARRAQRAARGADADQRHRGGRGLRPRRGRARSPGSRGARRCRCIWTARASPMRWRTLGCTPAELTWKAGRRRAELRRHQERLPRRRGGDALRPRPRLGVRAAPQARRASLLQAPLSSSAQMEAYLADGLWLRARGARQRPRRGAVARPRRAARRARSCTRSRPTSSSPPGRAPATGAAQAAGAQYYLWPFDQSLDGPDDEPLSARLVCNWATDRGRRRGVPRLGGCGGREGSDRAQRVTGRQRDGRARSRQMGVEQRQPVLAPEHLLADDVARRAEHHAAQRLVGVALQRLDRRQHARGRRAPGRSRRRPGTSRTTASSAMSRSSAQTARRKRVHQRADVAAARRLRGDDRRRGRHRVRRPVRAAAGSSACPSPAPPGRCPASR